MPRIQFRHRMSLPEFLRGFATAKSRSPALMARPLARRPLFHCSGCWRLTIMGDRKPRDLTELESPTGPCEARVQVSGSVHIELRRGATAVSMTWPINAADDASRSADSHLDATAWPALLAMLLLGAKVPTAVVGPTVLALGALFATSRAYRPVRESHR